MSALALALPALFQAGLGLWQTAKGNQYEKAPVPDYQISPALNDMVSIQRRSANGEMAGLDAIQQAQRATSANQMGALQKGGVIDPNAVNRIYGQERGALANVGLANANWQTSEKDKYINVLSGLAEEQKKEYEWETLLPYERKMAAAGALSQSGITNMYGALTSAADRVGTNEYMKAIYGEDAGIGGNNNWLKNIFSQDNQSSTPMTEDYVNTFNSARNLFQPNNQSNQNASMKSPYLDFMKLYAGSATPVYGNRTW